MMQTLYFPIAACKMRFDKANMALKVLPACSNIGFGVQGTRGIDACPVGLVGVKEHFSADGAG